MSLRTQENLSKDRQDLRDERWAHAQRTGRYIDEFTTEEPRALPEGDSMLADFDAARRRRDIMMGRMEVEHGSNT